MLFHTLPFFIFFSFVFTVFLIVKDTRLKCPWLLLSSYFFYGWWNPLYLLLVLYSTLLDYFAVFFMEKSQRKKIWLSLSITNSLLLLGFFKYAGFVTDNLNIVFTSFNIPITLPAPNILLPIGISFYTFQSMSYAIDFYRNKIPREKNFIRFAAFVSFFPQLVAGPIQRAAHFLPQLYEKQEIRKENITDGLSMFFTGFFKKAALADYLALYVDKVFANPAQFDSLGLIMAAFAFSWQIYFDFSGYTDMARGIARMMGFNLALNFNNPYTAASLSDFWKRWHISLSSWFKDYLYIPLGGNRNGKLNTVKNMFLTMIIAGIWHGANWTFLIWGILHAAGLFFTNKLEQIKFYRQKIPVFIKQILIFGFVTFAWIFFRSKSLDEALLIINKIFTTGWGPMNFPLLALFLCASVWIYQFLFESKRVKFLDLSRVRIGIMVFILLYLILFTSPTYEPFIYFQF